MVILLHFKLFYFPVTVKSFSKIARDFSEFLRINPHLFVALFASLFSFYATRFSPGHSPHQLTFVLLRCGFFGCFDAMHVAAT